jgi:hypothetical protein
MTRRDEQPLDYYEILRRPYNIPHTMQRYLCVCERDGLYLPVGIEPSPKYRDWVCTSCHKLPIYHFFICMECKEKFIRDFRHPKFCTLDPLCWNCLTTTGPICECVHPRVAEIIGELEPYLPKPKSYSPQELESVFDF